MSFYLRTLISWILLVGSVCVVSQERLHAKVKVGDAASDWVITDQAKLRLISSTTSIGMNGRHKLSLGLQFDLKPGWKIYWRSPGSAGFPPSIDWTGSKNFYNPKMTWPVPERFSILGMETLGYIKKVVFPISAVSAPIGRGSDVQARVSYLTCNKICIPYESQLTLKLSYGLPSPSKFSHLINRYTAKVPDNGRLHGLDVAEIFHPANDDEPTKPQFVEITAHATAPFTAPDIYLEGPIGLGYSRPQVSYFNGGKTALFDVQVHGVEHLDDAVGPKLNGRSFIVTLIDGERIAEDRLTLSTESLPRAEKNFTTATSDSSPSFTLIIIFAIIGGVILNFMPCVLPVLSLKIFSLISNSNCTLREIRCGFLASSIGIVATFLALGAALAVLRAGGTAIGWGIQFQQPWFLTGLILMVTLFACNLWGFFETSLPRFANNVSSKKFDPGALTEHFLSGVFATLLATPCTAPFLGTAVGFALTKSVGEMLCVFAALGIGLALPHLLITIQPKFATWLPKPGAWMIRLKFFLGLLLAGTGVWLGTVLSGVTGDPVALFVGSVALATIALLYFSHRTNGLGFRASLPGLVVLAGFALTAPLFVKDENKHFWGVSADPGLELEAHWQPFDIKAIPALVEDGKIVLVDITADWCITCQVNKKVVLRRDSILHSLLDERFVAMKADWTRPNDEISRYLASFGRFGIPFNVVYGPNAKKPIVLPEILTESAVIQAFKTAGAPPATAN